MKRIDDTELVLCLHCRRVRHPDEPGWEEFDIGASRLFLCPLHAPAFALGIDWGDRRCRTQPTPTPPPATVEPKDPKDEGLRGRRRRAEARLRKVFQWNMTPHEIHAELSRWVAGQDSAKRTLATAIRTHYRRVQMRMIEESGKLPPVKPDLLPKETILLLGPTGCGKSFTCRTLSKIVDVPFWQTAATNFSEIGYVGGDVTDILSYAISAADGYVPLAERSILMIDEIEKKAKRDTSGYKDVSGEGCQFALLELLETNGSKVFVAPSVNGRRNPNQPLVEFDTRDILFILGGAWVGLASIISDRLGGKKRLGFAAPTDKPLVAKLREAELLHEALPEDCIKFGMIPELMSRVGSFAVFDPLSREDLRHVMTEVEDAVIKQHQARAELEGFSLEFSPEAVDAICEQAYQSGMGARRLRSLTSEVVRNVFFDLPGPRKGKLTPRVVVTAATVEDPSRYEIVGRRRAIVARPSDDADCSDGEPVAQAG